MAIVQATDQTFYEETKEGYILVDFWATWCVPCKMLTPVLEELDAANSISKIVKLEVDANPVIAQEYGIMSVPTMLLMRDGEIVAKTMGYQPKELLEQFIADHQ